MNKIILKACFVVGTLIILFVGVMIMLKGIIFPRRYKAIVEDASSLYLVDPNIIYAVIKQESNFYENARSTSGAKGLMQLMDSTATEIATEMTAINQEDYNIYDPYTNIHIGVNYIAKLLNYFDGNYYLALAAYNAGLGRVSKWFDVPYDKYDNIDEIINKVEYYETKDYLNKVTKNYNWYVKLYK